MRGAKKFFEIFFARDERVRTMTRERAAWRELDARERSRAAIARETKIDTARSSMIRAHWRSEQTRKQIRCAVNVKILRRLLDEMNLARLRAGSELFSRSARQSVAMEAREALRSDRAERENDGARVARARAQDHHPAGE
jgi:hypothetical protein